MKWLKRSAVALVGLVLLASAGVGAALYAIGSERGSAWLVQRLLAGAPQISIVGIEGSLLDGLTLRDVRLRTAQDELDIDSLVLEWNAPALLTGVLVFERGAAERATYRRLDGPAEGGGGPPVLPLPLRVERASVATLSVTIAATTLLFENATATGRYEGRRLELDGAATSLGDYALTADAVIDLDERIDLDVTGQWSGPVAGVAARGSVSLTGTWPTLAVRHELTAPFAAATTGTLVATPFAVDVVNEWQALAWPSITGISSPSGRMTLRGAPDDYGFAGEGTVEVLGRSGDFSVEGTGSELALALAALTLNAAPNRGSIHATGTVDLDARSTELALTAESFDPAWIAAAWPGRLDGTGQLSAALAEEANATLDSLALEGELRGYPVAVSGTAAVVGFDRFRLDALRLTSDTNRLVLTGSLDRESFDLVVDADIGQLDLLVPDADGKLVAALTVGGTWQEPHGDGQLTLSDAAFAGVTVEHLGVSGTLGLAAGAPVAVTAEATGLERSGIMVDTLRATFEGTSSEHRARVEATAPGFDVDFAATGGLRTGSWRGRLDQLEIDEPVLGPWQLEEPAELGVGRGFLTIGTHCVRHVSNARWCTQLDVQGRPEDRLVVSGQNFDLATLQPLLPPQLTLDGVYQLSGSLFDLMGEPRGALALSGGTTHARVAFGTAQAFITELDRVQAGMTLTAGRLDLTAAIRSPTGGRAEMEAAIANVRARDSNIDGRLHVEWPDLGFLMLLSSELEQVAGALAVELAVGGTVAEPTVDGQAELANGRVVVPRWGLAVEDIAATASSADGRTVDIDVTGRAGDGTLTLAGTTALDADRGWPTRLRLTAQEAVLAVQRPDAEIYAIPDLAIDVALPVIDVMGTVHVPRANVTLDALPEQAVTPSPDAVVHGGERATQSAPLQLRTAITLTLGDEVRYTGLNLDTAVGGELRLATEPGRSANATGTLRLTGSYDAYGQRLTLDRGQLLFSGALDDPGLDVRAVRRFESTEFGSTATEAGIELTGTLKAPRTRIFSSPAMSEADALAYLLFGRPASGANSGLGTEESTTLETAALSLGLQQALPVVQRIGNSLGLDELTVQSTTTDAGALMAGKYLSPKLYVRYSYGLFNRIGGLLLRFRVNERLSIETRSGDQKSMDLLYTVEKD